MAVCLFIPPEEIGQRQRKCRVSNRLLLSAGTYKKLRDAKLDLSPMVPRFITKFATLVCRNTFLTPYIYPIKALVYYSHHLFLIEVFIRAAACISRGFFPLCSFCSVLTDHKFASAGREDIDVRMLGNGKSQSLLFSPVSLWSAPRTWTLAGSKLKVCDSRTSVASV